MSKNKSNPSTPNRNPELKREARSAEPDTSDIFVDEAAQDQAGDDDVKLTDISDIVAKYAVVDKVFDEDDDDEAVDTREYAPDREPLKAYEKYDTQDTDLPERPKIVFRRPKLLRDELHSNWSDNAERAVDDIKASHLREVYPDDDVPEHMAPQPAVLRRHRKKLARSVGISVGLPIVGGALFALVLYMQKDVKPTDIWGWVASGTVETTENTAAPTPNFAQHPEIRQNTAETTTAAAVSPPASPETGIAPSVSNQQVPAGNNEDDMATPPSGSPNPVYMARLTVSDTAGTALSPIPLSLAVAPGVPEQRLRIRISGLPEGAELSNGSDLSNGEWLLREPDLEDLTMSLAPGFSGQITLLAEVIDDATHIQAAPSQMVAVNVAPEKMLVQPAAAPPDNPPQSFAEQADPEPAPEPAAAKPDGPTQIVPQNSPFAELRVEVPTPQSAPEPETDVAALTPPVQSETPEPQTPAPAETSISNDGGLIAKGDALMNNGDIFAARLFYKRALKKGDARAATALGKSYDPVVFQQLKVHGVLPDPNLAIEWYRKGAQGGDSTATAHIQALSDWLKR
jgi:hypothetical protein